MYHEDENKSKKRTPRFNELLLKSANTPKSDILRDGVQSISSDLLATLSNSKPTKSKKSAKEFSKGDNSSSDELHMPTPKRIKKEPPDDRMKSKKEVSSDSNDSSSDSEPEIPRPVQIKQEELTNKSSSESDSEPEMPLPKLVKKEKLTNFPVKTSVKTHESSTSESKSEPEIPLPIQVKREPKEKLKVIKKVIANVPSPLVLTKIKPSRQSASDDEPEKVITQKGSKPLKSIRKVIANVPSPLVLTKIKPSRQSASEDEPEKVITKKGSKPLKSKQKIARAKPDRGNDKLLEKSLTKEKKKTNKSNLDAMPVNQPAPKTKHKDSSTDDDSSTDIEESSQKQKAESNLPLKSKKQKSKVSVPVPTPIKGEDSSSSEGSGVDEKYDIVQKALESLDSYQSHTKQKSKSRTPQKSNESLDGSFSDEQRSQQKKGSKGREDNFSRPMVEHSEILKEGRKRKLSTYNESRETNEEGAKQSRKHNEIDRTSQDSGVFSDERTRVNVLKEVILFTPRKPTTWQEKVKQHYPLLQQIDIEPNLIDTYIDKSESDIHLLRIPQSMQPKLLQKLKLDLNTETTFTLCGTNDKFAIKPIETKSNPCLIISDKPRLLRFKSTLKMNKYAKKKKVRDIIVPEKHPMPFPEMLKVRHPLFGADFEPKIKLDEEIELRLREAEKESFTQPKHKKKKKASKEKSAVDLEVNERIFSLLNSLSSGKNKRKSDMSSQSSGSLLQIGDIKREVETDVEGSSKKKKKTKKDLIVENMNLAKSQLYPITSKMPRKKIKNKQKETSEDSGIAQNI